MDLKIYSQLQIKMDFQFILMKAYLEITSSVKNKNLMHLNSKLQPKEKILTTKVFLMIHLLSIQMEDLQKLHFQPVNKALSKTNNGLQALKLKNHSIKLLQPLKKHHGTKNNLDKNLNSAFKNQPQLHQNKNLTQSTTLTEITSTCQHSSTMEVLFKHKNKQANKLLNSNPRAITNKSFKSI